MCVQYELFNVCLLTAQDMPKERKDRHYRGSDKANSPNPTSSQSSSSDDETSEPETTARPQGSRDKKEGDRKDQDKRISSRGRERDRRKRSRSRSRERYDSTLTLTLYHHNMVVGDLLILCHYNAIGIDIGLGLQAENDIGGAEIRREGKVVHVPGRL